MRIGKNELEIMEILAESKRGRIRKENLKPRFRSDCNDKRLKTKLFSRTLHSLTDKKLVMKYVEVSDTGSWEFDGWGKNYHGKDALLLRKPYDGKMENPTCVEVYLGLTKKGKEELEKRL